MMLGIEEIKDALGADKVIPVDGLSIHLLRQRIVRLEGALRRIADGECHAAEEARAALDG